MKGQERGGKKGAPRGQGRGQRKPFPKTDLLVTVPNEESGASRLKPVPSDLAPRKIVRLSQNKTESTDLQKVTIKSLDEIKREKEQRKESTASSAPLSQVVTPASQICNGATAVGVSTDINGSDDSSRPVKNEPGSHRGPIIPMHAEPSSSTSASNKSTVKPKLRSLTIPLKPLPTLSSANCKIFHTKPQQAAERLSERHEISMDFDSKLAEQDFKYLDDNDEDSNVGDDYDEELLLRENEGETQQDPQTAGSPNCLESNDSSLNGDGLSGYAYSSDEPEDDEISLHPDDSLFDEEDDPNTSNDRLRPRSLGRRTGSQSRDLRNKSNDRPKHSQESSSSTSTVKKINEEPENIKDKKQDMSEATEKTEQVPRRSDYRERNSRSSFRRTIRGERDDRRRPGDSRNFVGKRIGGAQFRSDVSRRGGHGQRQAPRKGSGPNLHNVLSLQPSYRCGDGLLPLPGSQNVDLISQLRSALLINKAKIESNLLTTVEMLTNPPPVPGEVVTKFKERKRQLSASHGSQSLRGNLKMGDRQQAKRTQSGPPAGKTMPPLMEFQTGKATAPVSSQKEEQKGRNIPKWLQKMYEQEKQKSENQISTGNAGGAASPNESTETDQTSTLSPKGRNTTSERDVSQNDQNKRPIHHSPNSDSNVEVRASASKRKSPHHGEMLHGGKIVVGTSPEGVPQPNPARDQKTYPKPLCPEQVQTEGCMNTHCQYWHLSKDELEEYQRSQQLGCINSHEHSGDVQPTVVQPQKKVDDPDVSYDLVNGLLINGNLGAAWEMIDKLRRMNHPPDLSILQHVLSLCSKHLQEPDVAAQVACKAFDLIGGMVVHHNRHNYETLIKTLCHSGQYIRAYEMLELMKKDRHAPTYEVFLDLVQASAKDPDWAFSLLDDIKQSGVLRSKICSDLVLLGCNSGEFFVERTWVLFQEALENQVQLTDESVSAILFTLFQSNKWDKIMSVLPSVAEALSIEILKSVVLNATQRDDWIETVIAVLAMTPAEKLSQLGADVWNTFLSNCCVAHGNNMLFAQKIYSLMHQNGISLQNESINSYMSGLSHANNWTAALELFTSVHEDPQVLEQPKLLESGLIALSTALHKAGASVGLLIVLHFMLEHCIKPEDSVLQLAVEYLDNEKNYKGVLEFFKQLQANAIVPPLAVYKDIVSSLEKWSENPDASCEPYAAMRRAYPSGRSDAANKIDVSSDSERSEQQKKMICRFVGTPRGCYNGDKCRFLHPAAVQSNTTVPSANMQMNEETSHSSGGSIPVGGGAVERQSSTFMSQSTSVNPSPFTGIQNLGTSQGSPQFRPNDGTSAEHSLLGSVPVASGAVERLSSTLMSQSTSVNPSPFTVIWNLGTSQGPPQFRPSDGTSAEHSLVGSIPVASGAVERQSSTFMSQSTSVNPSPFTEIPNLGTSQGPPQFRPSDGTSAEHSLGSMKSQSQGRQLCKFFSTPQGCRWGNSCRFFHQQADSNAATPEVLSGDSGGARVRDNHTGNPFVLRGPSFAPGGPVRNTLFGHALDWQPSVSDMVTAGLHSAGPVSSTLHIPMSKPAPGTHHFQLAGGGNIMGANPFSPTLMGRTQSLDGLSEQKTTEQNRQAHSAPAVPERPGASHFHYPSKTSIQFYLPRIKHASQHNNWEELGYVYINMKNEGVEIASSVFENFYQAFENCFPLDSIGEGFQKFASKVLQILEEGMPELAPDHSPSSSLDDGDRQFIGELGVALMYVCYKKQHFTQGYTVLHVLHNYSINYSLYSGEFGIQKRPLTTTEVALTAADICLNLEEPLYSSALEVLRGTNYALPANGNGTLFTLGEADWRRRVFQTLCEKFMSEKEFDFVHELLSEVGDIDVFGRREVKALYNELLVALINNEKLEVATEILKTMETNLISRDPETIRAFVNGCGNAGLMGQAKQHFVSGCISGVYPDSFNHDNPRTVVIGTSFSAFESQLYIEKHLRMLYQHIEDLARASGHRVLDDNYHKPLKVVIKSDEVQNAGSKYMRRDEIIRCVREMLCTMLTNDFNPPLSCEPQSKDEEITVDALSLKRWFCANHASGRSKRGGVLLTATAASTARLHPYLQPGMTSIASANNQEGVGRRVSVVSEADDQAADQLVVQGQQVQRFPWASPMSLTRMISGRGNPKKAHFKSV